MLSWLVYYAPVFSFIVSALTLVVAVIVLLNFKKGNIFNQWVAAQGGKYYDRENIVRRLIKAKYLFCWDNVPGKDNGKLLEYLEQKYGFDWVRTAKIEKTVDDKTIQLSGKNYLSLTLNDEKTKANLEIDKVKIAEYPVKLDNDKLKIYKEKSAFIKKIEEDSKNRIAVEHILDHLMIKAIGVKKGLIDRKLAIALGGDDVILYFEGLKPWIVKQEQFECGFYNDLCWFYWKCKDEHAIGIYKKNLEDKNNKSYWYIPKPKHWIKIRFCCMNNEDRFEYISKNKIYCNLQKPWFWKPCYWNISNSI